MSSKIKAKQINKIEKAIKILNETLSEMKEYCADPNYYVSDTGNFHVIDGNSHDEQGQPRQDRIMYSTYLNTASGGDW